MDEYIAISTLNDFIFCPYSIYLHNVYMGGDEELVYATPQTQGKASHETIDKKRYSSRQADIVALPVFSDELGIKGKIDVYKGQEKLLMKPNFRPVFFYANTAEANFLLRQKQYEYPKTDLQIAKILIENKIRNQLRLLEKTRQKTPKIVEAKEKCKKYLPIIFQIDDYDSLMGIEGSVAKAFFAAYFAPHEWKLRSPRTKIDPINATLDIGYTILFNYIEAFTRLFGFDPYIGVYHRLWFKRKAFNTKQCSADDFLLIKNEYILKREKNSDYTKMFYDVLINYKSDVFKYIRDYYRCFMQRKSVPDYPKFLI